MRFNLLISACLIVSIHARAQDGSPYYGDVACGAVPCAALITGANLDNISYAPQGNGNGRVEFRDKSRPQKSFWYSGTDNYAQGILTILLAAKSHKSRIKVFIVNGDYTSNSSSQYVSVTIVD